MASSALCCPVHQVLVHVYPGSSKAFAEPRVTVHIGRRGRPVQKPRLMPLLTALSVARKLQAAQVGTVSRCSEAATPLSAGPCGVPLPHQLIQ